ncbi:hypothetical protein OG889_15680 [Streptomyces sp. NBC_00481]|uniref:hypothetical protein n=1 Tax=Streptomyces sp. NBC_00481 TaxID=2975755 RepID=UPI002DD816DA|nr:hypothetical protein [Streptomyces sp. NBC_00481]WRY96050.1 hypothetical protein OG889_15680 [Streptomyces sp. NBC_00481]
MPTTTTRRTPISDTHDRPTAPQAHHIERGITGKTAQPEDAMARTFAQVGYRINLK